MPASPGPGDIGPPDGSLPPPTEPMFDSEGNPIPPELLADGMLANGMLEDGLPVDGMGEPGQIDDAQSSAQLRDLPPQASADEPGPQEAASVIREYYGAINSGSLAEAYRLWSNDGRASGQSPQQFANGFAQTAQVAVEIMQPGRIDAASGARYIEVPVAVAGTQRDGSVRRYVGAYTLRRSVADGATTEQRAWRITSADIREVHP